MRFTIAVALAAMFVVAVQAYRLTELAYQTKFMQYVNQFDKTYATSELFSRFAVFKDNLNAINAHNANPYKSWTMGVTQFSDLTAAEFAAMFASMSSEATEEYSNPLPSKHASLSNDDDDEADFGEFLGEPRTFGDCPGANTALAYTTLSSAIALKENNTVINFSSRYMIDCSGAKNGCTKDASISTLKNWLFMEKYHVKTQQAYPDAFDGKDYSCRATEDMEWNLIHHAKRMRVLQDVSLARLAKERMMLVYAEPAALQNYKEGIIDVGCTVHANEGTHVVLFGSGTDKETSTPFYRLRASFGKNWGEKGNFRVKRGDPEEGSYKYRGYACVRECVYFFEDRYLP